MYRKWFASLILVISFLAPMPAWAAATIDAGQYASDAGTKLGRGVVNAATGWVEIPKQTVVGGQQNGVLGGIGGFFKGIGLGAARTLAGAFEIATFWAPVPERFEPVMQPATVFGDWNPRHVADAESSPTSGSSRRAAAYRPAVQQEQVRPAESMSGEAAGRATLTASEIPLKDIFFEDDSAALRQDARESLLANAEWLRVNPHFEVAIEGHSDDRGESEHNQVLGYRRARVARDFLVASGIPPKRISIVSYGKERPFVLGHEEWWRRWNRRVHFVVSEALEPRESTLIGEES